MDTFVALIASGCLVALMMVGFKSNYPNSNFFTHLAEFRKVLHFLGMVIIAPITEEVIFRKYGRQLAHQRGWSLMKATAITALAFALWHGNPFLMVPALVLGVVVYVLYEKFKTLLVPEISNFAMFLGWRLGYVFPISNGQWKTEKAKFTAGPDVQFSGVMVSLFIGGGLLAGKGD